MLIFAIVHQLYCRSAEHSFLNDNPENLIAMSDDTIGPENLSRCLKTNFWVVNEQIRTRS